MVPLLGVDGAQTSQAREPPARQVETPVYQKITVIDNDLEEDEDDLETDIIECGDEDEDQEESDMVEMELRC